MLNDFNLRIDASISRMLILCGFLELNIAPHNIGGSTQHAMISRKKLATENVEEVPERLANRSAAVQMASMHG